MANNDYYDYSHYYDEIRFEVFSIAPGWPVLVATTAYTAICITVGFLFICRKKKWRNKDKHSKSGIGNDGELGSPSTNASQDWVDPTPYMCAVDEVVGNTLFDQELIDDLDDNSIESFDSNKAYEYFFGQDGSNNEEVGAEMSYELFADGNRENSRNSAHKIIELSNVIIENSPGSRSDAQSQTIKPLTTTESFMDNPVPARTPKVRLTSLQDREKKTEPRRLLGRKSRRFSIKKREKKTVSNQSLRENDEYNFQRFQTFNRIFHAPNNLEIEVSPVDIELTSPARSPKKPSRFRRLSKLFVSESTQKNEPENRSQYLSSNEGNSHSNNQSTTQHSSARSSLSVVQQDVNSEPSCHKSLGLLSGTSTNKAEMISTSIDKSTNADQSVEGNDTYQKEMNEINKLAIP
jgi:hypothetical protein